MTIQGYREEGTTTSPFMMMLLNKTSRYDLAADAVRSAALINPRGEIDAHKTISHILHLVSHVEGAVADGRSALDVLKSAFPAGTLSGAPKPRALQLLDEWEPTRRGPYGGVVGYFDLAGTMDMAINIRSVTLHRGQAHVQAGAGIVADSDPQSEADETLHKAYAVLNAIALAADSTLEVIR